DGERYLETQHRQKGERREHVVRGSDDGREAEAPLEADGQIDERDNERDEDCDRRLGTELGADARADELAPADGDVVPVLLLEGLLDVRPGAVAGRGVGTGMRLGAHGVLRVRSKLRDLGVRITG